MVACGTRERDAKKRQQRESERAPSSSFLLFLSRSRSAYLVLRVELLVDVLVHERGLATPESPRMITLSSTFFREAIFGFSFKAAAKKGETLAARIAVQRESWRSAEEIHGE